MPSTDRAHRPRWYAIPGRVLLVTLVLTLLTFAVTLLISIAGLVLAGWLHGTSPDLPFAYRHIALPVALVAGSIVFVLALVMEIRHYRQARTLAGIARASQ
jgi:hypothetical protein